MMDIEAKYFMGLLILVMTILLMADAAEDNSNGNIIREVTSLMNSNQSSMSKNNSTANDTAAGAPINESIEMAMDSGTNSSPLNRMNISEYKNKTSFKVGTGLKDNESAFEIDVASKPVKNASKMWYLIQGVPHGYT